MQVALSIQTISANTPIIVEKIDSAALSLPLSEVLLMKSGMLLCLLLSLSVSCSHSNEEKTLENPVAEAGDKPKTDDPFADVAGDAPAAVAPAPEGEAKVEGDSDKIDPEADAKLASSFGAEGKSPASEPVIPAAPAPEPMPEMAKTPLDSPTAEMSASASEKIVYPTSSRLNVRRGPGTKFGVAHVIKFGSTISLSGERKKGWLKTTDGLWVSARYTAENKPARVKHIARKKKASAAKVAKVSATEAPVAAAAPAPAAEPAPAAAASETAAP